MSHQSVFTGRSHCEKWLWADVTELRVTALILSVNDDMFRDDEPVHPDFVEDVANCKKLQRLTSATNWTAALKWLHPTS